jgi:ketose-bisphosphate aldolase
VGIVSMTELLKNAKEGKYAVGYFESWNLESTKAVINAAEEMNSPVIIGFNGGILTDERRILKPEDLEVYGVVGRKIAEKTRVPVAFILNEITNLKLAVEGVKYGFNALMFESETDDLEENIVLTRKVVEMAHSVDIAVESNLGILPSAERSRHGNGEVQHSLTQAQDAKRFVNETGIDALGVSIGNVEVLMNRKAELNFSLLGEIHEAVDIPLTLHGGSGIADKDVPDLIAMGVYKMNLGAALNGAFIDGMKRVMKQTIDRVSPKYAIGSGLHIDILAHGENAMKELVKHKMKIYGSSEKV